MKSLNRFVPMNFYKYSLILFLGITSFSCDKDVSVTPPEELPNTGKLFVDSDPPGAYIYLNGKNTGNLTPDTVNWLDEGKYTLTLKKRLFKDVSVNVNIYPDSITHYFLNYSSVSGIFGKIFIDSSPRGADIYINGTATGKKTQSIIENLFPGTYDVTLKLNGFWDETRSIEVRSGVTSYLYNIPLIDSLTWANFNTNNSGLPDNFLNHIAIEKGYIKWIATVGSGLAKFDDKAWLIYNTSNSPLPINNVKYVGIDNQNRKWICVSTDLLIFDDISWTIYNSDNSPLPAYDITCVAFEANNTAWIGTYGGGAVRFDGSTWTIFNTANSDLHSNFITTIAIDKNNNKWIGTHHEGIAKYNDNHWSIYNGYKSGVEKNASRIAIDLNNTPWVAIRSIQLLPGGSAFFEGLKWEAAIGIPSKDVLYVDVDAQNQKWFCNSETGISKLKNESWTHYTAANSRLPNDRAFAIAIDDAGNKWIATYGGGLAKYKGN